MRMVQLTKQEKENILENLLKRSPNQYDEYQEAVNEILENVKKEGDKAVFDYTKRFIDHAHHPKEDDFLFRLLRQRSDKAEAVLLKLEAGHQQGPIALRNLRQARSPRSQTTLPSEIFRNSRRTSLPIARFPFSFV